MRITCDDVDDFLVNVMEEGPDNVSQKVIHVSYIKKPIDASSGTNFVVKLGILLQASAVMNTKDGEGQYVKLPNLTTAQRDMLEATDGMEIFNMDTGQKESYRNGGWGVSLLSNPPTGKDKILNAYFDPDSNEQVIAT